MKTNTAISSHYLFAKRYLLFYFSSNRGPGPALGYARLFASVILKGSIEYWKVKLNINRGSLRAWIENHVLDQHGRGYDSLIFLLTAFDDAT